MASPINLNWRLRGVANTDEIQADGPINLSQGSGIKLTAGSVVGAGSTTADATSTPYHHTLVTSTIASGGIRFDAFADGDFKTVKNLAATVLVYPPTGGRIDNAAVNAGFSVASALGVGFQCISSLNIMAIKGA